MRKLISLLTCGLMAMQVFADNFTQNGLTYTTTSSSTVKVSGYTSNLPADVVIPKTVNYGGGNYSVTAIADNVFQNNTTIKTVTVGDNLKNVGKNAFDGCTELTKVTAESLEGWLGISFDIGISTPLYYAHHLYIGDNLVTDVTIPGSITSLGQFAFRGCTDLKTVVIPNTVTSIGLSAFNFCSGLTSINIPNSVTIIDSHAFNGCTGLLSLYVPSSVTIISFSAFENVAEVINGSNVTGSFGAKKIYKEDKNFEYTDNTRKEIKSYLGTSVDVVIPDYVTSIAASTFKNNTTIETVSVGDNLKSIGSDAFNGCTGLTCLVVPNSVTTIGEDAFKNVKAVAYSGTATSGNWGATTLYYHDGTFAYSDAEKTTIVLYIGTSVDVVIPDHVTSIAADAFKDNTTIKTISVGNNLKSIGSDSFNGCIGLTCIVVPNSVTTIGDNAFKNVKAVAYNGTATGAQWGATTLYKYYDENFAYFDAEKTIIDLYIGTSEDVVIPDYVTSIAAYAFYNNTAIKTVTIGKNVKSVGMFAFQGCTGLEKVSAESIESWLGIYFANGPATPLNYTKHLYVGETEVKDLVVPESITSIQDFAFWNCEGLESVTMPNTMQNIGRSSFGNCKNLQSVNIPNSVTYISTNTFNGCVGLTSVLVPSTISSIGTNAFYNVQEVRYAGTIDESPWGAKKLVIADSDFEYADKTKKIIKKYIGDNDSIVIPSYVEAIGEDAFLNKTHLKYIDLGTTLDSIALWAFYGCTGLTNIDIPSSVRVIGRCAFKEIKHINYYGNATYESTDKYWGAVSKNGHTDGDFIYADNTEKELIAYVGSNSTVSIPDGVEIIGASAFQYCDSIKSIVIPNTVTKIGEYAFYQCYNLESLTIGQNVETIDKFAFEYCTSLMSVDIPEGVSTIGNGAFHYVTNINYTGDAIDSYTNNWGALYRNCTISGDFIYTDSSKKNLAGYLGKGGDVVIPNGVKIIEPYAFYRQYDITSITLSNEVTVIGENAFESCKHLASVKFNNTLTTIDDSAFYMCTSLKSINLPNTVKRLGKASFEYCSNLKSATLSSALVSINALTFYRCEKLESISIPSNATSIGEKAFGFCHKLTSVYIPNTVKSIGEQAFYDCSSLKNLEVPEEVESIDYHAFYGIGHIVYKGPAEYDVIQDSLWSAMYMNETIIGDFVYYDESKEVLLLYIGNDGKVTIDNAVKQIFYRAFAGCYNVKSVKIPETVNTIGMYAFKGVRHIEYYGDAYFTNGYDDNWSAMFMNGVVDGDFVYYDTPKANLMVYIGNGGKVNIANTVKYIGDSAFVNCDYITSVNIPKSVKNIGNYAFTNCSELTSIVIGDSVQSVGNAAFAMCTGAKSIYVPIQVEYIGDYAFLMETDSYNEQILHQRGFGRGKGENDPISGRTPINGQVIIDPNAPISLIGSNENFATIYCRATSEPSTWSFFWNYDNLKVEWGSKRVNLIANNPAYGTVSGTEFVTDGVEKITITATPADDYHFLRWSNGNTSNSQTISITSDTSIMAYFERHIIVTDKYLAPTCEEKGLTEGSHCSTCYHIIIKQVNIPATGHNFVVDSALTATCTHFGLTEGKHCSVCDSVFIRQDTIPAIAHTIVVDSALTATCTHFGLTEGKHCSVCDTVLVLQDTIPAAHTIVVLNSVSATCTTIGLTEGKYCSACDSVFVAQDTIPMLKHLFTNYIYNNDATYEADGTETAECDHGCGATDTRTATGTKLTGIDDAVDGLTIYAHHNVIVVENANDDIFVYDAIGRLVARRDVEGSVSIILPHQGLYIVKCGEFVKRVVLK